MADTPLAKKLGIKPDHTTLVINAPEGYVQSLGTLPNGVEAGTTGTGQFDFVQLFVGSKADMDKHAPGAIDSVKPGGLLWFSYPKKSSAMKTDVTRDIGWEEVAKAGWRPVTQIAIDETWSALRFRPVDDVKPIR
mgnify:CR=1 FL=1